MLHMQHMMCDTIAHAAHDVRHKGGISVRCLCGVSLCSAIVGCHWGVSLLGECHCWVPLGSVTVGCHWGVSLWGSTKVPWQRMQDPHTKCCTWYHKLHMHIVAASCRLITPCDCYVHTPRLSCSYPATVICTPRPHMVCTLYVHGVSSVPQDPTCTMRRIRYGSCQITYHVHQIKQ